MAISVLKEDRQALGLFVAKCNDEKNAFTYPLKTYPLSIADPSGKLYQLKTKHVFRNDLIKLCSNSVEKTPPRNAVHIYDGMAIVRSVPSQKTWGDLWKVLLKCFTPEAEHLPAKVHIIFDNYMDDQIYSVKATKRADRGEGKRLHIGSDSQEIPQGDDYKDFYVTA